MNEKVIPPTLTTSIFYYSSMQVLKKKPQKNVTTKMMLHPERLKQQFYTFASFLHINKLKNIPVICTLLGTVVHFNVYLTKGKKERVKREKS